MSDVHRLSVAITIGSIRQGRFASTVAGWFLKHARQRDDIDVDVIDLADCPLHFVLGPKVPPEVAALAPRLAKADAFVVVTPEYNHSLPASLKNAIDWYSKGWHAKSAIEIKLETAARTHGNHVLPTTSTILTTPDWDGSAPCRLVTIPNAPKRVPSATAVGQSRGRAQNLSTRGRGRRVHGIQHWRKQVSLGDPHQLSNGQGLHSPL